MKLKVAVFESLDYPAYLLDILAKCGYSSNGKHPSQTDVGTKDSKRTLKRGKWYTPVSQLLPSGLCAAIKRALLIDGLTLKQKKCSTLAEPRKCKIAPARPQVS